MGYPAAARACIVVGLVAIASSPHPLSGGTVQAMLGGALVSLGILMWGWR